VLHDGKISEMKIGEGKAPVATLPVDLARRPRNRLAPLCRRQTLTR
jgi:preprotein translocase subunit SecA